MLMRTYCTIVSWSLNGKEEDLLGQFTEAGRLILLFRVALPSLSSLPSEDPDCHDMPGAVRMAENGTLLAVGALR
jgi:hypothetical protein